MNYWKQILLPLAFWLTGSVVDCLGLPPVSAQPPEPDVTAPSQQAGPGLWIPVKAITAQWLLQHAWGRTLRTQEPTKPWPWADTWPVGRLLVPGHGIDFIILADASGRSLAFGPGKLSDSVKPGEPGGILLSGHRDTHFQFLQFLQEDDRIDVEWPSGDRTSYTVQEFTVVDSRHNRLANHDDADTLILTTCYPFDAIVPGGPLRYVVRAEKF
jgi:sortase A